MTPDTYCMSFNPRVKKKKETEQYFGEAMNTLEYSKAVKAWIHFRRLH
jgi:hypothetical protein